MQQPVTCFAPRVEPIFDLHGAIARGELALRYQPIVDLLDGSLFAVEALVRWHHPELGELLPAAFLPQIDNERDHRTLDIWVLRRAMEELDSLPPALGSIGLTINVGAEHLAAPRSIVELAEAIASSSFEAGRLVLELTENTALRDTDYAVSSIAELKRAGVRFAIDDFGTGFATLDYLGRLPADFLKIDRSFVAAFRDDKWAAIVEAVLALAQRLGIATIVEGVEQFEQLHVIRTLGARYAQGYFLSRPLTLENLKTYSETPPRHRLRIC